MAKQSQQRAYTGSSQNSGTDFDALQRFLYASAGTVLVLLVALNFLISFELQTLENSIHYTQGHNEQDSITGYSTKGVGTVGLEIIQPCNYILAEDWNLFSLCADAENDSIEYITQPIDEKYNFLLEWDEETQQFEVYSKRAINKPFTEMDRNKSYFVYMDDSSRFSVVGEPFDDMNLSLEEKWATPTYPYIGDGNITEYIQTIQDDYYFYMLWDRTNQLFDVVSKYAIEKPVVTIPIGHGQFIYITNPNGTQLEYNKAEVLI